MLTRVLGALRIPIVVRRRLHPGPPRRPSLRSFAAIGAGASFLSALLGSMGPLMAPLFLACGLVKDAYIGTEALATVVTHVVKLVAYGQTRTLPMHTVLAGIAMGPLMIAGSYTGKRIVDRLAERVFVVLIEATMVDAGMLFLVHG
jgi:uncharacterized membrane protein YfcA